MGPMKSSIISSRFIGRNDQEACSRYVSQRAEARVCGGRRSKTMLMTFSILVPCASNGKVARIRPSSMEKPGGCSSSHSESSRSAPAYIWYDEQTKTSYAACAVPGRESKQGWSAHNPRTARCGAPLTLQKAQSTCHLHVRLL